MVIGVCCVVLHHTLLNLLLLLEAVALVQIEVVVGVLEVLLEETYQLFLLHLILLQ